MANKQQMTGMRGVYLVAAELAKQGFIVSPTSRSALGADLLVTDQRCRRAWSVQVKTNGKPAAHWLVGKRAKDVRSKTHIYVLVNLRKGDKLPDFYVVPSRILARRMYVGTATTKSVWHVVFRDRIKQFKDAWSVFGVPW